MTGQAKPQSLPRGAQPPAADVKSVAKAPTFDAVAGDGIRCSIVLNQKTLFIDREIGGLNCRVSVPAGFYEAVCLNILEGKYSVTLSNSDSALSLTIDPIDNLRSALDLRDDLARQLRLPGLTISRDGEISGDERKLGSIVVRKEVQRRGSQAIARRPRFLARRKRGGETGKKPISGREIIARH